MTAELVVLVTPYVVRATARANLSRPDDGFADASDPASSLLGRLNRIYGVAGPSNQPRTYNGKIQHVLLKEQFLSEKLKQDELILYPDY
jgi:Flp pilus assembly secretin CpaC